MLRPPVWLVNLQDSDAGSSNEYPDPNYSPPQAAPLSESDYIDTSFIHRHVRKCDLCKEEEKRKEEKEEGEEEEEEGEEEEGEEEKEVDGEEEEEEEEERK